MNFGTVMTAMMALSFWKTFWKQSLMASSTVPASLISGY